jgi:hypothetical protein
LAPQLLKTPIPARVREFGKIILVAATRHTRPDDRHDGQIRHARRKGHDDRRLGVGRRREAVAQWLIQIEIQVERNRSRRLIRAQRRECGQRRLDVGDGHRVRRPSRLTRHMENLAADERSAPACAEATVDIGQEQREIGIVGRHDIK